MHIYQLHNSTNPFWALHAWPSRLRVQEIVPQLSLWSGCALSWNRCGWAPNVPVFAAHCDVPASVTPLPLSLTVMSLSLSRVAVSLSFMSTEILVLGRCRCIERNVARNYVSALWYIYKIQSFIFMVMKCLILHCRCILRVNSTHTI